MKLPRALHSDTPASGPWMAMLCPEGVMPLSGSVCCLLLYLLRTRLWLVSSHFLGRLYLLLHIIIHASLEPSSTRRSLVGITLRLVLDHELVRGTSPLGHGVLRERCICTIVDTRHRDSALAATLHLMIGARRIHYEEP